MAARTTSHPAEHLVRLAGVVAVFLVAFLLVRRAVIPQDFGKLGHYRPAALDDNRSKAMVFAGQTECVLCHETEDKDRKSNSHAKVSCEACHGPSAAHANANDQSQQKPAKLDIVALCAGCHAKDVAKPAALPQVVVAQHNADAGACINCHHPHKPKF